MFKIILTVVAVSIFSCNISLAFGKQVAELQSLNFELAITSYRYLSVLFFDYTEKGIQLESVWNDAASKIDKLCDDCEIAKVSVTLLKLESTMPCMVCPAYCYCCVD